ncbi:MAG: hypothetical protein H6617_11920 [Bdellovibrionaceae bacterium]|nr:hypothetical protein [Pseudobdellovibrionaceae bacterium]
MKLENQYKDILDSAFKTNFPEWEAMSPLDPMKVMSESLSASLAQIEKRQSRFTNTVLDCLPALFSFESRKASLPTGLFAFNPNAKLVNSQKIGPEAVFRFESEKASVLVSPSSTQILSPVLDFKQSQDSEGYHLSFRQVEGSEAIRLHFVPESTEKMEDIRVTIHEMGNVHEFCQEDLLIRDTSDRLGRRGSLEIEPIEGQFGRGALQVEITIATVGDANGTFHPNLIECTYYQQEEFVELGALSGEPWEEVALDSAIVNAPAELHIHFPDDHSLRIRRIDTDILKLRHANYERFNNSFFYNGVNHSLILPNAHKMVQRYTGGVTLLAPKIHRAPASEWLDASFEASMGEYAAVLEGVEPVCSLEGYSPRESKVEYLRRFYGAIRTFCSATPADREFIPEQFKARAIALDDRIKCVELAIQDKQVDIYVLTRFPAPGQGLQIEPEIKEAVSAFATENIPMEYSWSVQAFRASEPLIQLSTEVHLDGNRMGLLEEDVLHEKISNKLSHLILPPPFGLLIAGQKYSKEALLTDLVKRLTAPQGDNSHLRRTEVKSLHGLIVHGDSSKFENHLTRAPGQVFFPQVEVSSRIRCSENVFGLSSETGVAHA